MKQEKNISMVETNKLVELGISENRWNLAGKLIEISDDEWFVNGVDSACETEDDVEEMLGYIERTNPTRESVLGYTIIMRYRNGTHPNCIMKAKYIGKDMVGIRKNKVYGVMGIEKGWYRIMTELDEDYLFPPEAFEIIEDKRDNSSILRP